MAKLSARESESRRKILEGLRRGCLTTMVVGNVRVVGRADELSHDFGSFRLRDYDEMANGTERDRMAKKRM
jgi:hypothetical protein